MIKKIRFFLVKLLIKKIEPKDYKIIVDMPTGPGCSYYVLGQLIAQLEERNKYYDYQLRHMDFDRPGESGKAIGASGAIYNVLEMIQTEIGNYKEADGDVGKLTKLKEEEEQKVSGFMPE